MIQLVICSPILHVDAYAQELAASLLCLRKSGLSFTHLVVGPEKNRAAVAAMFAGTESIFHPERGDTKGVFDAVAQGYAYALKSITPAPTHLAYINADDLLEAGFVAAVSRCRPDVNQIVTGEVNWIGEQGETFGRVPGWPWTWQAATLFEAGIPAFTQQGTIISASVWVACGGFDPRYRYIADSVFWHRILRERRVQREHVPEVVASYRLRSGQLSGNRSSVALENSQWQERISSACAPRWQRGVIVALMRLANLRIYMRRVLVGQRMRSEKATVAGGF